MGPLRPPQKKTSRGRSERAVPASAISNCNQKDVGVTRTPLHLCPARYYVSRPLVPSAYRRLRSAPSILTVSEPSGGQPCGVSCQFFSYRSLLSLWQRVRSHAKYQYL